VNHEISKNIQHITCLVQGVLKSCLHKQENVQSGLSIEKVQYISAQKLVRKCYKGRSIRKTTYWM